MIVSFRIPSELVKELRESPAADHYLDLSELIRGIVRKHWLISKDPIVYEIEKMRRQIIEEIRRGKSEE